MSIKEIKNMEEGGGRREAVGVGGVWSAGMIDMSTQRGVSEPPVQT